MHACAYVVVPAAPVNVSVSQLKAHSALVTWSLPEEGAVIGYCISQQVPVLSVCFPFCLYLSPSVYLFVSLSVCPSVDLSVRLSHIVSISGTTWWCSSSLLCVLSLSLLSPCEEVYVCYLLPLSTPFVVGRGWTETHTHCTIKHQELFVIHS